MLLSLPSFELKTCVNTVHGIISSVVVQTVFATKGIVDSECFLWHCHGYESFRRVFLDHVSSSIDIDVYVLSVSDLCYLLLCDGSRLDLSTIIIISESNFHFSNKTKPFNKQLVEQTFQHPIETIYSSVPQITNHFFGPSLLFSTLFSAKWSVSVFYQPVPNRQLR